MSEKGYCVVPELYEELCRELTKLSIPYRTVERPEGLGEKIRPVLISAEVAPRGWARYKRCKSGQHGNGLNCKGIVYQSCRSCSDKEWMPTAEYKWSNLEEKSSARELVLPSWIDQLDVQTVADVRRKLIKNELNQVGPARALIITEALAAWRNKTIALLTNVEPEAQRLPEQTLTLLREGV